MTRTTRLLCVSLLLLWVGAWLSTLPEDLTPPITIHANDLQAAQWAGGFASGQPYMVNGDRDPQAPRLSPGETRIYMLRNVLSNFERPDLYSTASPITYVVASLPALTFGFSSWTLRLGPLMVMLVLIVATFWLGYSVAGPVAGIGAACMVSLYPVMIGASRTCFPTAGKMAGVSLTLAILYHSDALRRPVWSVLGGVSLALCLRWGESVGDGLVTLAAASGPGAVVLFFALLRIRSEGIRAGVGPVLMGISFLVLADIQWIQRSLGSYILKEAQLSGGPSLPAAERLWQDGWVYAWAVRYRLVGLVGSTLMALGVIPLVWRVRPAWKTLGLLAALVVPWVILTLSTKRHAYYAAPVLPVLAVISAAGLSSIPRVGPWLVGLASLVLLPGWVRLTWDKDFPSSSPREFLAEDLLRPDEVRRRGDAPMELDDDIRTPGVGVHSRRELYSRVGDVTRSQRSRLPMGSLVVIQGATPMLVDVVGYRLMCFRPDLQLMTVAVPQHDRPSWFHYLERAPDHLIITLDEPEMVPPVNQPGPQGPPVPLLPAPTWLGPVTLLEKADGISMYRLTEDPHH